MNKETISNKQGISLVILFIIGSASIISTGVEAGKDCWLATLCAIIISLPILMMYAKILSLYPEKDLYDIIIHVYGKYLGKLISILYIWFAFHLGALIITNFGEFINAVSMPETPKIIPMIMVTILCIWGVKLGIEVLGRWAEFALPVLIFFITLKILLLIPDMDINNILPLLSKGIGPVYKGAFLTFTFPFAETIIFCLIFSTLKEKKSSYKIYLWGLIIGGIIVFSTSLTDILVLGERSFTSLIFPSHGAATRINIADFVQRLEIIVSISYLGGGFIKVSMCLMGACRGIAKILEYDDYRFIVLPVALLMLNLSHFVYDSSLEMIEWIISSWRYYATLFQLILPIFILLGALIKKKKEHVK